MHKCTSFTSVKIMLPHNFILEVKPPPPQKNKTKNIPLAYVLSLLVLQLNFFGT